MSITLPELPFALMDLEPWISRQTMHFHYEKHHAGYVKKLNELIQNTRYEQMSLEDIIQVSAERESDLKIFDNAAQAYNHDFFWKCLTPKPEPESHSALLPALEKNFGSFEKFQSEFKKTATELFGSGWVWLVRGLDDKLSIKPMADAGTPLIENLQPLLCCDVWEHAYYIDCQNERDKFVDNFFQVINWDFVLENQKRIASPRYVGSQPAAKSAAVNFKTDSSTLH